MIGSSSTTRTSPGSPLLNASIIPTTKVPTKGMNYGRTALPGAHWRGCSLPLRETITSPDRCLCTCARNFVSPAAIVRPGEGKSGRAKAARMISQGNPERGSDRPNNNLLKRLNEKDFSLIAPHLSADEAADDELLYNPGDDVDVVHFP